MIILHPKLLADQTSLISIDFDSKKPVDGLNDQLKTSLTH